jgi:hypothetical protein
MKSTFNLLLVAVAMAGTLVACGNNDAEYASMDRDWDTADSSFMVDYQAVMDANTKLEQDLQAMKASGDTAAAAQYAQAQEKIAANRQALADMDAKRAQARAAREAARKANDRAAYDAARATNDYNAWKSDLDRIRASQTELQGTIKIGSKTVGAVDANVKDTSKPLLRVEPGKNDDKPLIEMNKNPKNP